MTGFPTLQRVVPLVHVLMCLSLAACEQDETPAATPESDAGATDSGTTRDAGALPGKDSGSSVPASDAGHDASKPASDAGGNVDPAAKIGEFSLQLIEPKEATETTTATAGSTALLGKVFDGPAAEVASWAAADEAVGCTLYKPKKVFCNTPCGSGSVCVDNDVCRKSPAAIGVGALRVQGVKTGAGLTEFTTEPLKNTYQAPAGAQLPYPAFEEGAPIALSLAGGSGVAAFELETRGIAPLVLAGSETYTLEKGKPLDLAWTPAAALESSRITVKLDISHHGGSKGKIECDVDDDGSLSIPATLVDALTDLGVAGFPTVVVTREASSSASTALGKVDLRVYMYISRAIVVPGFLSCTEDEHCPTGQTCQDDLTCK